MGRVRKKRNEMQYKYLSIMILIGKGTGVIMWDCNARLFPTIVLSINNWDPLEVRSK